MNWLWINKPKNNFSTSNEYQTIETNNYLKIQNEILQRENELLKNENQKLKKTLKRAEIELAKITLNNNIFIKLKIP